MRVIGINLGALRRALNIANFGTPRIKRGADDLDMPAELKSSPRTIHAIKHVIAILFTTLGQHSVASDEASKFVSVAIDAMASARHVSRTNATGSASSDPVEVMQHLLESAVAKEGEIRRARVQTSRFSESDDLDVRQTAVLFESGLFLIEAFENQVATLCEKFLNNPEHSLQAYGTTLRQMGELAEQGKSNCPIGHRTQRLVRKLFP